ALPIYYNITREDADQFAVKSHEKALKAITEGKFREEIVPIEVEETYADDNGKRQKRTFTVDTDEGPRPGTTMEVLANLKPAFKQGGQVTAGNSSQTSDGAAFALVMSERMVKELNLEPLARLVTYAVVGLEVRIMSI